MKIVKCKHCGKEFETDDWRRKFCSYECYDAYYDDYRNERHKELRRKDPMYAKKLNEWSNRSYHNRKEKDLFDNHAIALMKCNTKEEIIKYLYNNFKEKK